MTFTFNYHWYNEMDLCAGVSTMADPFADTVVIRLGDIAIFATIDQIRQLREACTAFLEPPTAAEGTIASVPVETSGTIGNMLDHSGDLWGDSQKDLLASAGIIPQPVTDEEKAALECK